MQSKVYNVVLSVRRLKMVQNYVKISFRYVYL